MMGDAIRRKYRFMSALWPTYVDRELPLTKTQRKAIHRDAWRMWMKNRWNLLLYLTLPIAYIILLVPVRDLAGQAAVVIGISGIGHRIVRVMAMIGLTLVLFVLGGVVFQRYRFAPLVYEAVRRSGYDVCHKCGYWLRDLKEDSTRCPECGTTRRPMPTISD